MVTSGAGVGAGTSGKPGSVLGDLLRQDWNMRHHMKERDSLLAVPEVCLSRWVPWDSSALSGTDLARSHEGDANIPMRQGAIAPALAIGEATDPIPPHPAASSWLHATTLPPRRGLRFWRSPEGTPDAASATPGRLVPH